MAIPYILIHWETPFNFITFAEKYIWIDSLEPSIDSSLNWFIPYQSIQGCWHDWTDSTLLNRFTRNRLSWINSCSANRFKVQISQLQVSTQDNAWQRPNRPHNLINTPFHSLEAFWATHIHYCSLSLIFIYPHIHKHILLHSQSSRKRKKEEGETEKGKKESGKRSKRRGKKKKRKKHHESPTELFGN